MDTTAAVVGGGPAGLVAARRLAEAGVETTLFERESAVGGRVRSTAREGFVLDHGFQVLFTAYPAARRELDFDALDLRRFAPGAVVCRPGHRSVLADPFRDPGAAVETLLNPEVTLRDKLRVVKLKHELAGRDPRVPFEGHDRTVAEYLAGRGFSADFVESFAAPFYGGITLDRTLSSSAAVFEFTFGMLATGAAAVPAEGMGAVTAQLADRAREAGVSVETDRRVTAVEGDGSVVADGETRDFDAVVVSTDPPTARGLTGVESIPTDARGCVTQYYRFPDSLTLDSGGRLLLNAADDRPNHVVPHSEVAPEHAPDDATLVSATFLGDPAGDDDALAAATVEALREWFPARRVPDPGVLRTDRVPFAQFAQPPGFYRDLPDARSPAGVVYLAGECTRGSSIDSALESGRVAAEAALVDR